MQLELLILIRLASVKSLSREDLVAQVGPLAGDGFAEVLASKLQKLTSDGLIVSRPKSLSATDRGRARALEELKLKTAPRWDVVQRRHLPEIGVAALIARRVLSAFESGKPEHGELAAIALEVLRLTPDEVSDALRKRTAPPPPPPPPLDFVAAVHAAVARVPAAGRFGAERVFISALWKQLDEGAGFPGLTLDGFKKRLLEASRKQQLTLARADLSGAMDRATVAASEIKHLNSTFHFVLDRSRL